MSRCTLETTPRFSIVLSLTNPTFRLGDLYSAAETYGFGLRLFHPWASTEYTSSAAEDEITGPDPGTKSEDEEEARARDFVHSGRSAFVIVEFTDRQGVAVMDEERCLLYCRQLGDRCIMIKSTHRLFHHAPTLPLLHSHLQQTKNDNTHLWKADQDRESWAFDIQRVGKKRSKSGMKAVVDGFSYMGMTRPARLEGPEVTYTFFEEYELPQPQERAEMLSKLEDGKFSGGGNLRILRQIYFGRFVCDGAARGLLKKFEVKERAFYGNTSMESEMSLLMAGQTLAAPGKMVYDPFAGTGSLLYTCAHWGSIVVGSDIDGRQMRGKETENLAPGVFRAADKYGLRDRVLDCLTFDVTRNMWRRGGIFDAIITDPPYGVRAGAKRLGRVEKAGGKVQKDEPVLMPDGQYAHLMPGYMPVSRPYEMVDLVHDLVLFSRYMLVKGGRLVFFLPTVTEDWDDLDLPVVEGMKEIKWSTGSSQDFGKWSRRLITIEKIDDGDYPRPDFLPVELQTEQKLPGHHNFRDRFAEGFVGTGSDGATTPNGKA